MNKNKMIPYDFSFDECKLGEMLFSYREKKVISIISAFIRNNTLVDALTYVGRFLLKKMKVDPQDLEDVLYKYIIIVIYLDTKRNSNDFSDLLNNEFDSFDDGISLEDLINLKFTNELYKGIYLGKSKIIKEYISLLDKAGYKFSKKIESILKLDIPYFSKNLDLEYYLKYSNATKLDLIVCEIINSPDFENFTFEINDSENFIKNLEMPSSGIDTFVRGYITYMGYLVNEILGKHRFYIDIKNTTIIIATLSKEFNPNRLKFLVKKDESSNIKDIDYSKVIHFDFTYNNEKYSFTNSGIKKI